MGCNCGNIVVSGTELKFALALDLPSPLTMDGVDFRATFYIYRNRAVTIEKADMVRGEEGTYVVVLDTTPLGSGGTIRCQVEVELPDSDCADGVRTEIIKLDTNQMVIDGVR